MKVSALVQNLARLFNAMRAKQMNGALLWGTDIFQVIGICLTNGTFPQFAQAIFLNAMSELISNLRWYTSRDLIFDVVNKQNVGHLPNQQLLPRLATLGWKLGKPFKISLGQTSKRNSIDAVNDELGLLNTEDFSGLSNC